MPALPPVIRYYDEFEDKQRSIPKLFERPAWTIWTNGNVTSIDFLGLSSDGALLLKHTAVFLLGKDLRIATVQSYINAARYLTHQDIVDVVAAGPTRIVFVWKILRGRELTKDTYNLLKSVLRLLCQHRLNGWSNDYLEFLRSTLTLPFNDKYAAVRSGAVFLSSAEESFIVRHLDEVAASIERKNDLSFTRQEIADAGMLLCAFQFAMRPVQIGMLTNRDVRVWETSKSNPPSVHLTFSMAKQRSNSTRMPLTRRVKQEWAPIFIALEAQVRARTLNGTERLFGVKSNTECGSRILALLNKIGCVSRGATDLRHTAAQRLVDAGANHEELSEFMGHSFIGTGLVYYDTSATQAERINAALGASPIYQTVARIAHDRFISAAELHDLKDDQQIAGVPHGIPIEGIGGCSSGQPACPYNPITSCYGCRKFMPILDKAMHERVLGNLRNVVSLFFDTSRGNTASPAYLQLQHTISEVQSVIGEIEAAGR